MIVDLSDVLKNIFADKKPGKLRARRELVNYERGVAPDKPSFTVNQEKVQREVIKQLENTFSGIAMGFLLIFGNTGDGKTHILNSIKTALAEAEQVFVAEEYLRDEKTDIFKTIIQKIDYLFLRKCIKNLLSQNIDEELKSESAQVSLLSYQLDLSYEVASVLRQIAYGSMEDMLEAVDFLTGKNRSTKLLNRFKDFQEQAFYVEVVNVINYMLKQNNKYLVILLDEFEHILDWEDKKNQRRFFRHIKELLDRSSQYTNICILIAATEVYEGEITDDLKGIIESIEPALYERLQGVKVELESVSSGKIIEKLAKKILNLYKIIDEEKNISPEEVKKIVEKKIDISRKENYRKICQIIMDSLKNEEYLDKVEKSPEAVDTIEDKEAVVKRAKANWISLNPNAKKSYLIDSFEVLFNLLEYDIANVDKRQGWIKARGFSDKGNRLQNERLYAIAYTSQSNNGRFIKDKFERALKGKNSYGLPLCYFIYPDYACPADTKKNLEKDHQTEAIFIPLERDDLIKLHIFVMEDEISEGYLRELANYFANRFSLNTRGD